MRHFDNIVFALVISGAACFAAMGCAVPEGVGDESTGDAREACTIGGELSSVGQSPIQGEYNKKQPSVGQTNEYAPVQSPSKGEFDKKMPSVGQTNEYAPVQSPSKGEFNKKMPSIGQTNEYAPVQSPSQGRVQQEDALGRPDQRVRPVQSPIQGELNKGELSRASSTRASSTRSGSTRVARRGPDRSRTGGEMRRSLGWTGVSLWLAASGCGAPPAPPPDAHGDAKEAAPMGAFERPEAVVAGASRRLADAISADDIGKDFGVPEGRVPYADTYWPFVLGGANATWNPRGRDPRPPIEKYMAITDPYRTELAEIWEYLNHGPGEPGVTTWHGHCPGWSAAATTHTPVLHAVFAGSDGRGGITGCREGDRGCVRFEIGDVNALMAEVYLDGPYSLIGTTCNLPSFAIPRDPFGRILARGCDGVNAGSLLVAASTLLKRNQVAFTIDLQKPTTTDQIWNQPTYRYHVYDYHPLTEAAAANLVERGATEGRETVYRWNSAARGFAFVDLGLRFVGEQGPNLLVVPGARSTYEMRVSAVIELDADPADPRALIIGGEYLDLPASHATRLNVAPYLCVSRGAGPEVLSPYVGGDHHNPYVRPSLVERLITLGQI